MCERIKRGEKTENTSFMATAEDKRVILRMISTHYPTAQGCSNSMRSGEPSTSNCTCNVFVTEHWKVDEGKPGRQLLSENIWINRTLSELSLPSKTHNYINQKHNRAVKFPHYSNLNYIDLGKQALVSHPTGKKITPNIMNLLRITWEDMRQSHTLKWSLISII